jgi:hypothetical protein
MRARPEPYPASAHVSSPRPSEAIVTAVSLLSGRGQAKTLLWSIICQAPEAAKLAEKKAIDRRSANANRNLVWTIAP